MTESSPVLGHFLLGVGAQKAGTSWLHQQLQARGDTDFGVLKEYHVHDARTLPALARFRRIEMSLSRPRSWIQPRSWMRQLFIRQPGLYYDYFAWLLRRNGGKARLTGDITPSYAALSADTLQSIQASFQQRGIAVKPVFLMRDPIERLISSQRMKQRKLGQRDAASEIAALRRRVRKAPGLRSGYGRTLHNLNESFGLEHCYLGLYETLFQRESYAELCGFLNLPYAEPAWHQRVNVSATGNVIPDDLLAAMGSLLADDLRAVEQLFPYVDLERHWPTASRWCR
ncbi:sulfotransferase family protein [Synechococcus sp. CS-197]|uniref:sulfotransferase family protein n=1 Tax=Synechococcus sp. CS-197 TaxID=2847985 RepID=UPI00015254C6|nr:sulfotransferase family protein [Synechococcus sp. CS-197]MCT0250356.1 sulfotransferase family protein [Synechococcus sp. CS-197]CAK22662.1 Conserved hypothetical protein [Synechococcus sp. WH 7803]